MVEYLKFTPKTANNWARAWQETQRERPWAFPRVIDSFTESQVVGKLWLVKEVKKLKIKPDNVALIGGWYAHFATSVLIEDLNCDTVTNFEIDHDSHFISFKFNRRYKEEKRYRSIRRNVLIQSLKGVETWEGTKTKESQWDVIVNTSCEHMFPMWKFRKLNPQLEDSLYILQSTDATQYEDHINCVKSVEELADQARIKDIKYSGSKKLPNGMTRFMVIGK